MFECKSWPDTGQSQMHVSDACGSVFSYALLCCGYDRLQVCSAILVKLIMDLWLGAGPSLSFPLVLRMLRKALGSPKAEVGNKRGGAASMHAMHDLCLTCWAKH